MGLMADSNKIYVYVCMYVYVLCIGLQPAVTNCSAKTTARCIMLCNRLLNLIGLRPAE